MKGISTGGITAAVMLAERAWRHSAVVRFFKRPAPPIKSQVHLVSILQPILSGDPTMPACLEANLMAQTGLDVEFIWLVDLNDSEGERVCRELMAKYPHKRVRLHLMPPPGERENPKMVKLIEGLTMSGGDVVCVLDDDTVLPDMGLETCLPYLDLPRVGLAFGLPYYTNFSNVWSSLVSCFVDSHSLLTYIPYTALTEPFTINGMFYAIKRSTLDRIGGFDSLKETLADDFAVARLIKQHGLKLAQTPLLHGISTQVTGPSHYLSLIQRWFIFPRESLMRHLSLKEQATLYGVGMLPALYPLLLLLWALWKPSRGKVGTALLYFAFSFAQFVHINRAYLRGAVPADKIWLAPLIQAVFPLQLLAALLSPKRIVWRGHVMQVEKGGGFRFVKKRDTEG